MKFFNNDTIAIVFLGSIALCAVFFGQTEVVTASLGAIGGYIGSQVVNK